MSSFQRTSRRTSRLVLPLAPVAMIAALTLAPRRAIASPPAPELLAKLAAEAEQLASMGLRASYSVDGKLERLDDAGKTDEVRELKARVEADGRDLHFIIDRYVVDGEDKTSDEQRKVNERAEEKKTEKKVEKEDDEKNLKIPFLASQQGRYVFDQAEVDAADPSRVRITFVPREAAKDTFEGSVWVDAKTGHPYSAGFKLSKPGTFVDWVHFTVEMGEQTTLGPAISHVTVDGRGGLPFFHHHYQATATLRGYRIAPEAAKAAR